MYFKISSMIFHRYWFQTLGYLIKTCKLLRRIFLSWFENAPKPFVYISNSRGQHLLTPLEEFCCKPNPLLEHPQSLGLCGCPQGALSLKAAKLPKSPLQGGRANCSSPRSWVFVSFNETACLWSSRQHLRKHLQNIKATDCGRTPAIWLWPSAISFINASPL